MTDIAHFPRPGQIYPYVAKNLEDLERGVPKKKGWGSATWEKFTNEPAIFFTPPNSFIFNRKHFGNENMA